VSSKLKMLAFPLQIVGCAVSLTVLEVSLTLYEKQHSNSLSTPQNTLPQGATAPTSQSSNTASSRPKSERELAIDGFIRNYAERVSEGEHGDADYLANQVFRFNEMTDDEFTAEFAN
jgi:hypothetical protein